MAALGGVVYVGPNGEIVIPLSVREASALSPGSPVAVETSDNGILVRVIDPDQAWFWTPEWQDGEREADAQIASGDTVRFESDDEMLAYLDRIAPSTPDPNTVSSH